jgi:hypothetical protein
MGLPNFTNDSLERSKTLDEEASAKFKVATDANQTGDDYILSTVYFALVLFFAGVSTKLDYRLPQRLVLVFAVAGLLFGFGRMLTLPFH